MEKHTFHPARKRTTKRSQLSSPASVSLRHDAFRPPNGTRLDRGRAHKNAAVSGRAMQAEIRGATACPRCPARPVLAIVGGVKVLDQARATANLVSKVQVLVLGGAMANTFLAAEARPIGRSLAERDLVDTARSILTIAVTAGCDVILPVDVIVAHELEQGTPWRVAALDEVDAEDRILDIGPHTVSIVNERLARARTVVWNGPLGAFEVDPFDAGTKSIARSVARLTRSRLVRSVAGGGDTVAALRHAQVADEFSFVSVAGGAFLEWFEGKKLPGVEALKGRSRRRPS